MKLFYVLVLFLSANLAFSQHSNTQRYLEAGVIVGLNNYSGDVAEKTMVLNETRLGLGAFARYHFSNRIALRAQFYSTNISGTDANARDKELKERSLRFRSVLLELCLMGEWNFMNVKPIEVNGIQKNRIVPYLLLGIGGVLTRPKITYYGPPDDYGIHVKYPIPESGHLREKLLALPFGGGIRMKINEFIVLGAEGCWRPVLSDLLDGVSLNGNTRRRDWYYSLQFMASYIISGKGGSVKP